MNHTLIIFRKELKDILRDRRTIYAMVLFPMLLSPLLITLMVQVMKSQTEKAKVKEVTIGLVGEQAPLLFGKLAGTSPNRLVRGIPDDTSTIQSLIQKDSLDAVWKFAPDFQERLDSMERGKVIMWYQTADEDVSGRMQMLRAAMDSFYSAQRLAALGLDRGKTTPLNFNVEDQSSSREIIGKQLGGMLPYFFMIFCFMGCMYPAIDLTAGEKERGTLETLLVSPAKRLDIFLGKFLVVALSGFVSAMLSIISLALSIKFNMDSFGTMPPEVTNTLMSIASSSTLLSLTALLVPLTFFFASMMIMLGISAQSFKEAQSLISPLMIIVLMPTLAAFLPGIELNASNALIPIFNVSMAAKEVVAGTVQPLPYTITVVSLIVLAVVGMLISQRVFNQEKNILPS
jgi:sodium transport system permease protein